MEFLDNVRKEVEEGRIQALCVLKERKEGEDSSYGIVGLFDNPYRTHYNLDKDLPEVFEQSYILPEDYEE